MTWRILNAEPLGYSPQALQRLSAVADVTMEDVPVGGLARRVGDVDALIVRLAHSVDADVLAAGQRLKAVVTATTGLDHIDLSAATAQGVEVLSLRGETAFLRTIRATAEHTWALLLALVRRLPWAFDGVRRGEWQRDDYRGGELSGKRLGILGLGRLGEQVAVYGRAFGMSVAAYDPFRQDWPGGVDRCQSQQQLAAGSDILSIHLPLNAETTGLVDHGTLSALPRGAVVVNTARGPLVDEEALLSLLDAGHLAGAALDVIDGEVTGEPQNSPLVAAAKTRQNLLLTPHIGGATWESMHRTEDFMADKLCRFLATLPAPAGARP